MVLVVLEIKVLIEPRGPSRHLIRPLKVWLALDFLQHSMHRFSEYNVNSLCVDCFRLPCKISSRAIAVVPVRPKIPHLLRDNLLFSLALQLILFYPLILVDPIHQLRTLVAGLPIRDFLRPCPVGRLFLNVLTATSSYLSSSSLYISQNRSE